MNLSKPASGLPAAATTHVCPESGARHHSIPLRRDACAHGVYVGHPVSGIRMARIVGMERRIQGLFAQAGTPVELYFPMRSTHLAQDAIGGNEYEPGAGLFSDTRHFTLQNRVDALFKADAVLINYDLADDAGEYRVSKGIPFDWGWARAIGRPVVAVIGEDNPNWTPSLRECARVVGTLEEGVAAVRGILAQEGAGRGLACVEVFDFTGCRPAFAMLARLAEADARKALGRCAAIITVMPEGRDNPNWHGQVGQVSDWILPDLRQALAVAGVIAGGRRPLSGDQASSSW